MLHPNRKQKIQCLSRNERPVPISKPDLHPQKSLVCVWWNMKGIIHYGVLEHGRTTNADDCCQQLEGVNEQLPRNWHALVNRKSVVLQHDSARAHTAIQTQRTNMIRREALRHPPYSLNLALTGFHLFRSPEYFIRDKTLKKREEVKNRLSEIGKEIGF